MSSAGTVLGGRYTLVEKVGGGGMGSVWRAEDGVLARPVAVKILRADLFEDGTGLQRFRREAQLVAAVDHPGIVGVHDYGESGGDGDDAHCAYIVMDLIEGRPLDRVLEDDGPMSAERALRLLADALDALHAAHRRGIVHRDLKPSNLMVREDGGVVITDFGIARAVASTKLTAPYAVIGTAAYMSPEQASGETTGPASDLYSIGVVGYELLVGRVPYQGEGPLQVALKHVNQPVPELPETFPAAVRALIATALAKQPEDRFESAAGMAAAARVAIGLPGAARKAADSGTVDLRADAGAAPAGGAAAAAAVGAGAAPGASPGAVPEAGAAPASPTGAPSGGAAVVPAGAAVGAAPAAPEQLVRTDPQAETEPGRRRSRRTLLLPVVVPIVISMGTATVLLVDRGPGRSDAAVPPAAQPTVVVTVPAAPAATTPAATTSGPVTPSPTDTPSAAPSADQQATVGGAPPGTQLPVPVPAQGGGGSGAAQGRGGSNPGGGAAAGGASGGQPAGGGTAADQPPSKPGNPASQGGGSGGSGSSGGSGGSGGSSAGGNPPAPPAAGRPASCGGSSWSTIVSVKDGRPIGMRSDNLNGDNPIVLGGASQYGWVRATDPGNWILFNACNNGGPQLVQTMDGKVVLSNGYSFLTRWTVRNGSTPGSYTLGDYQNQSCMTDNGPGNELTMVACTPGNTAQEWRLQ
ncbi:serine/threonine-protein kinase [Kitasatospora sp. NPDC059160]|uniref:serine/threonine-protein kinase n=1 Tax=Kitasatospora sp. NPDC059160 TaxID=3346748 RepID=UPI003689EAEF